MLGLPHPGPLDYTINWFAQHCVSYRNTTIKIMIEITNTHILIVCLILELFTLSKMKGFQVYWKIKFPYLRCYQKILKYHFKIVFFFQVWKK